MESLTLTIHGDKALAQIMTDTAREAPQLALDLAWKSAYTLQRELRLKYSAGPIFARSGAAGLAGSVEAFAEMRGSGTFVAGAGAKKFTAIVHEEGRTIFPRTKRVLHFVAGDGREVFTRGPVRIPARKPAELASRAAEPMIREIWVNGLSNLRMLRGH